MAACLWDSTRLYQATLSGGDLVATASSSGVWRRILATQPADANYSGGRVFEVTFSGASFGGGMMIGLARVDVLQSDLYNTDKAWLWQSSGNKWHNGSAVGISGGGYTPSDRLMIVLKNGKMYIRKNGTYVNGGDPDAETGWIYSGLTGDLYPVASPNSTGVDITLHCGSTITGSIPTGAYKWDQTVTLSATFVSPAGVALASQAVEWAMFSGVKPSALSTPEATGTATLDGSGVLSITYYGTRIAPSGTGSLLVSTTAGTAAVQCLSHYMPVQPTIA